VQKHRQCWLLRLSRVKQRLGNTSTWDMAQHNIAAGNMQSSTWWMWVTIRLMLILLKGAPERENRKPLADQVVRNTFTEGDMIIFDYIEGKSLPGLYPRSLPELTPKQAANSHVRGGRIHTVNTQCLRRRIASQDYDWVRHKYLPWNYLMAVAEISMQVYRLPLKPRTSSGSTC